MKINIIFEDADIIVCEKPAGVPTESKNLYTKDMVSILKNYLKENQPLKNDIEPYLGLIHRLDQPVGGVMVFAKTPASAKDLSRQVQEKTIKKYYYAVITEDLSPLLGKPASLLTDYLVQDKKTNTSFLTAQTDSKGKKSELLYRVLDVVTYQDTILSLAEINLLTGRHHQIRVQMAHHHSGLYGDKKYNPLFQTAKENTQLGLFSFSLTLQHPKTKKILGYQIIPKLDLFELFKLE
ncbi:RluA family pseudouridine synthase [Anaeromicropila populeti]|uniref:RNA pseudouridylate synthase n=1 Tax=Anaeromicropila populeti TaxID=37658 RepID=A0A1I6I5Y1_9FIRM|nr:RluA family pseudouridine synthase [Anaeromicropila populeti]SFR62069.1 23S rRNA pseudouridine1911/1915/1917 synthase [Anaeromicropila populeti]